MYWLVSERIEWRFWTKPWWFVNGNWKKADFWTKPWSIDLFVNKMAKLMEDTLYRLLCPSVCYSYPNIASRSTCLSIPRLFLCAQQIIITVIPCSFPEFSHFLWICFCGTFSGAMLLARPQGLVTLGDHARNFKTWTVTYPSLFHLS